MNPDSIDPSTIGLSTPVEILDAQQIELLDPAPIVDYVCDLHGFRPSLFDDLVFLQSSRKLIRAARRPVAIPARPAVDRVGIEFLRVDMATPRITTAASMTWAGEATKNVVELSRSQSLFFLRRKSVQLDGRQLPSCSGRGFVLVRHQGWGIGVGFLESTRPDDDTFGQMRSMYPSAFAADVADVSPFGNPCRSSGHTP